MGTEHAAPTISVVIPTRDRTEILKRCLLAVLGDEGTTEVVVVVDGKDPETLELLDRIRAHDSRVRTTATPADPPELGRVQRARNHGAVIASSEVILALDDDVVARPGMVSGHARRHAEQDDLVVVGYMPVATTRRWPRVYATVSYYSQAYEFTCELYRSDPRLILSTLWGGNVSVRRRHWLDASAEPRAATNLFDDRELGLQMLRDGLKGVFDPNLRGDHWYERSLRSFVDRAQTSPVENAELRAAHPDLIPDEEGEPVRLRGGLRLLLRLAQPSAGWWVVKWSLITTAFEAGVLRFSKLEDLSVRLLWRVANERARREIDRTDTRKPHI
jgi:glycosyltransferase involved in cell wall biosynthesis